MVATHWGIATGVAVQSFKQYTAALEVPHTPQWLPALAVGSVVPTHFVPGSSACREKRASVLRFSLHDFLRGWLLPLLDLCNANVRDCLRVDMSCVSQLEPGIAAAPSQAFSPGRLRKAVLPELQACGAAPRQLSRFHFPSLYSSARPSSGESLCAQCLFPSWIQPTSCCLATPGRPKKNILWKRWLTTLVTNVFDCISHKPWLSIFVTYFSYILSLCTF